jgi:Rap1a immunity proteins
MHSADAIMRGCRMMVSDSTLDDPNDSFLAGVCAGTIDGLVYEANMLKLSSAPAPHAEVFCVPKETTIQQQIRVVVKYVEARPERMHERFALLALLAREAWPCEG